MRKLLLLIALAFATTGSAQIPNGIYRVITWQYATSEEVLTDGVFSPEQMAVLKITDNSISLYIGGYPALVALSGEWKDGGTMWYLPSLNVKTETSINLFCNKSESLEDGWMSSVYYSKDCIERFGVVKDKK